VGDTLGRTLGLSFTHVHYRGGTALLNDLLGGRLEAGIPTLGDLLQQERGGRLRLLASTGPVRSSFAPHLPTFEEQKVPGLTMRDWMAVVIAGSPPAEVVSRVGAQVRTATASEALYAGARRFTT
jgi:tripartite-type tricarboxylate transporter receptor subunit TctC